MSLLPAAANAVLMLGLATPVLGMVASAHTDEAGPGRVIIAHLAREDGDEASLEAIQIAFAEANPGYDLIWKKAATSVASTDDPRIVFVQDAWQGENVRYVDSAVGSSVSTIGCGDIIILRPGEELAIAEPIDLLVFTIPHGLPEGLPVFVRPDWDNQITDSPGGCATEEGAYRRVLLTWLPTNGPYICHDLNAHRVRITDSFSHYHPVDGGFDEFYLVQAVNDGARIIVSDRMDEIVAPENVTRTDAEDLLQEHELSVGDLVYLPRGVVHRGLGGVLAQVITAPGFRPGAEIGVDHHLKKINDLLELARENALPFNVTASEKPVVK